MTARSEPLRSYFDTTLGSVFFNLRPDEIPELMEALKGARRSRKLSEEKRREYADFLMAWVSIRHYPLLAHEWCHALQALTHPALYLRCLREWSAVCAVVDELSKAPQVVPVPFFIGDAWFGDLTWPTYPVRISVDGEGQPRTEDSTSRSMPNDISEADLLEDSASIFQYRAEIGSEGTAGGYRCWLNEGSKYLYAKVFEFVSGVLSPADAYIAIPPLVMAAYGTNWPVHIFTWLLAGTVREAPARPSEMGTDLYCEYLDEVLQASLKRGPAPEPRRNLLQEGDPRRIDAEAMHELAAGFPMHPLTPVVERAWEGENIGRLREAMLHPYHAFSRRNREAEDWLEPYRPAVTSFRVLGDGFDVGDTLLYISPTVVGRGSKPDDASWEQFLMELMRIKAFVFAVATPFVRSLPHNCPHTECGYHQLDMCHTWAHVPARHEECTFPAWLRERVKRRVNFDDELLMPIDG